MRLLSSRVPPCLPARRITNNKKVPLRPRSGGAGSRQRSPSQTNTTLASGGDEFDSRSSSASSSIYSYSTVSEDGTDSDSAAEDSKVFRRAIF